MWYKIKGVSFWRNCGAASMRKYENLIWFLSTELIDACKLASVKRFWAEVSSVSPLQSKLQKVVIVLSRKGYIVVTTTKDRPPPLTMAFITIFLRALSSMRWARVFNFISGRYNCWCRSTQSYEANQIHIQFTSTRVYNVFYLEEELLLVHVSLFAPENNFPPDHTEDIGWNFVFTDKVKRLKIPFSWYLYRLYRFKEVNLALLYYYQPAWHTCGRYTMKTILLNRGRLGTKTSIFKYSAPTCSVTAHRLEIYKRKDVRWKNWKKGNENV